MSKKKNKLDNAVTDNLSEFNSEDKTEDFFSLPKNIPGNEITIPDNKSIEDLPEKKQHNVSNNTNIAPNKDQKKKSTITEGGILKKALEIIMNKRAKKHKENPHFELPELNDNGDDGKILLTVLFMFAIIFAGFMVYYFYPAAPLKKLYISSSLDSFEEHSGKSILNQIFC